MKKYVFSITSIFCALAISFLSVFSFVTPYASASESSGGGPGVIRGSQKIYSFEAINFFCDLTGFTYFQALSYYSDVYASDYGVRLSDGYNMYFFWKDDNYDIHYRFINIEDDTITYSCCNNAHCPLIPSDSTADPSSVATITGEDLKAMAADMNSRYVPISVQDSYLWSYQSSTTSNRLPRNTSDYLKSFQFEPYVPVYSLSSGTWGGKGWGGSKDAGVYILPFWYDDNNSHGVYYNKYYAHIYCIPATSDSAAKLCLDVYNLSDGSLFNSYSRDWNSDYTHYAFRFASYFSCFGYKSNADYYSNSKGWACLGSSSLISFLSSDYTSGEFHTMIVSSSFTPDTDKEDDWGYYVQNKPFELFANQTQIDFNQIPDNYVITINGDTIYDYSITNPDTGDSTTINNYITNNYIMPSNPGSDDPGSGGGGGGGSVSGDITVGGKVDVNGEIIIKTDPIDINVNVNGGGGSGYDGTLEAVDLSSYFDTLPEQSKTLTDYLEIFFSFLPPQLLAVLLAGIGAAVLCRLLGR